MEEREYQAMYEVEKTHWWFVSRRRFVGMVLSALGQGTSLSHIRKKCMPIVVDIGAGTGGMIPFLRRYGEVYGIEPNARGRWFAKKRGIVLAKGSAEHTGMTTGSADMVCFFDVLYHQGVHDSRALSEAKRVLRPGGWLVITDCALPWLSGPHDREVHGRERYTVTGIAQKVQAQGFIVQRKTYMFFLLFPFIAAKRILDRLVSDTSIRGSDVHRVHPFINTMFAWLCRLESRGLPYISYPWGSSLLLIARKKAKNRIFPPVSSKKG